MRRAIGADARLRDVPVHNDLAKKNGNKAGRERAKGGKRGQLIRHVEDAFHRHRLSFS